MKYIRKREDFLNKTLRNKKSINEQFNISADGTGPMGNDINWGDSLVGRLLSSTWRKLNTAYQGKKVKGEVNGIRKVLDQMLNQMRFKNTISSISSNQLNQSLQNQNTNTQANVNQNTGQNVNTNQANVNQNQGTNQGQNVNVNQFSKDDIEHAFELLKISYLLGLLNEFNKAGYKPSFIKHQTTSIIKTLKTTKHTKYLKREIIESSVSSLEKLEEKLEELPDEGKEPGENEITAVLSSGEYEPNMNNIMLMKDTVETINDVLEYLQTSGSSFGEIEGSNQIEGTENMSAIEAPENNEILEKIQNGILKQLSTEINNNFLKKFISNNNLFKDTNVKWPVIFIKDNSLYYRFKKMLEFKDGFIIIDDAPSVKKISPNENIKKIINHLNNFINKKFYILTDEEKDWFKRNLTGKFTLFSNNGQYYYAEIGSNMKISKKGNESVEVLNIKSIKSEGEKSWYHGINDLRNSLIFNNEEECINYIKSNSKENVSANFLTIENHIFEANKNNDISSIFAQGLMHYWSNTVMVKENVFKKILDGDVINNKEEQKILIELFKKVKEINDEYAYSSEINLPTILNESFNIINEKPYSISLIAGSIFLFYKACEVIQNKYNDILGEDETLKNHIISFVNNYDTIMKLKFGQTNENMNIRNYKQFINEDNKIIRSEEFEETEETEETTIETHIVEEYIDLSSFRLSPQMINIFININNYYSQNRNDTGNQSDESEPKSDTEPNTDTNIDTKDDLTNKSKHYDNDSGGNDDGGNINDDTANSGGRFEIDFQDILQILKLINRAYKRFTTPTIPSGREKGRVSNRTFRKYEYLGTGESKTPGGPDGPGYGPWRNIYIFTKYYNGIMDILDDAKYKVIWNDAVTRDGETGKEIGPTVVKMGDGRLVEGGGKIVAKLLINSTDGDRFFKAGMQRNFLNKYFGIENNNEFNGITKDSEELANNTKTLTPISISYLKQDVIEKIRGNKLNKKGFIIQTENNVFYAISHYYGDDKFIITYTESCKYLKDHVGKNNELSSTHSISEVRVFMNTINEKYNDINIAIIDINSFKQNGGFNIDEYKRNNNTIEETGNSTTVIIKNVYGLTYNKKLINMDFSKINNIDYEESQIKDFYNRIR